MSSTVVETMSNTSPSSQSLVVIDTVPATKMNLRLLMVSGLKSDLLVNPSDTVAGVKQQILDSWPRGWSEEIPRGPANLRLLLRGKFLEDASTINDAKIPLGQTTIVHLLIRSDEALSSSQQTSQARKRESTSAVDNSESQGCRCSLM